MGEKGEEKKKEKCDPLTCGSHVLFSFGYPKYGDLER
jgi:hypothetical protein